MGWTADSPSVTKSRVLYSSILRLKLMKDRFPSNTIQLKGQKIDCNNNSTPFEEGRAVLFLKIRVIACGRVE